MGTLIRLIESIEFRIWRWFFTIILFVWSVLLIPYEGYEPFGLGTTFLFLGVLPCTVFLLLIRYNMKLAAWLAYGHTVAVTLLTTWECLTYRPDAMGLCFISPAAGFLIEFLFLTTVLVLGARLARWLAYGYDIALLVLLVTLMITQPDHRPFYFCLVGACIVEGVLLTLAITRTTRRVSPVS